jgi:hypothetical protein
VAAAAAGAAAAPPALPVTGLPSFSSMGFFVLGFTISTGRRIRPTTGAAGVTWPTTAGAVAAWPTAASAGGTPVLACTAAAADTPGAEPTPAPLCCGPAVA